MAKLLRSAWRNSPSTRICFTMGVMGMLLYGGFASHQMSAADVLGSSVVLGAACFLALTIVKYAAEDLREWWRKVVEDAND